jgi:hypothetical protein
MKEFVLLESGSFIDLKILIVDFDLVRNLDLFNSTIAKILIANTQSIFYYFPATLIR